MEADAIKYVMENKQYTKEQLEFLQEFIASLQSSLEDPLLDHLEVCIATELETFCLCCGNNKIVPGESIDACSDCIQKAEKLGCGLEELRRLGHHYLSLK